MAEKTDFYVAGYRFGTIKDAEQAQLEQKKAAYFESKLRDKDAQNILAVYDRILDEKIFKTPVGWEYLKYLQERLCTLGVNEEQIRPVPMYLTFVHDEILENQTRQSMRLVKKRDKSNDKFIVSVTLNLFLAFLIIAMFVIAINSKNPNILNYRNAIVNEYASWEQELTEREAQIRQKEAELFTE